MAQFKNFCIAAFTLALFSFTFAKLENLYISETPLPWEEANGHCASLGKVLLSIHTQSYDREVFETLSGVSGPLPTNLWTSGREVSEGVWRWVATGEPFYHTRWFIGQPDDKDNLNCFYLASKALFYWRDANCSAPMHFICEDPADAWK